MDRIEEKLDKVIEDTTQIRVTLARQEVVLDEHQRRSTTAENNIELLRAQIKPLESHVLFIRGVMKTLGVILTIAGVVGTFLKLRH